MKRDITAWAVKIRGRSFLLDSHGYPKIFSGLAIAEAVARQSQDLHGVKSEATRVKVRIEEIE
jgi:hypothetical protein